jgi:hypothetical protein
MGIEVPMKNPLSLPLVLAALTAVVGSASRLNGQQSPSEDSFPSSEWTAAVALPFGLIARPEPAPGFAPMMRRISSTHRCVAISMGIGGAVGLGIGWLATETVSAAWFVSGGALLGLLVGAPFCWDWW